MKEFIIHKKNTTKYGCPKMYLLWRNIEVYIFSFIIVIKIQTRYNDIDAN